MEKANLILEYLKILVWPVVCIYTIYRFRGAIDHVVKQVGNRVTTSEKLKVDMFGQKFELSGKMGNELKSRISEFRKHSKDDS